MNSHRSRTENQAVRWTIHAAALLFGLGLTLAVAVSVSAAPEAELFERLLSFHGHTCAGSLFGARLGFAAKQAVGDDGKLKAKYFDQSCPVDGIQVAAGTTVGNRVFEVIDRDEHRLILTNKKTGRQVEAVLTAEALETGGKFRELSAKIRSLPPDAPEAAQLKADRETVLDWLRTAPDSAVVDVRVLK